VPVAALEAPRKVPRQERARVTVDAILRATAHILRSEGYEACSTNAVARKAGVSIGSLYQYFPSKEALVTALARQHAEKGYALLMQTAQEAATSARSIEDTVRGYIKAMVELHAVDPVLHRVLTEQVPRINGLSIIRELTRDAYGLVRAWLESQRSHLREVDLDAAAFVLVTSVEATTHSLMAEKPASLTTQKLIDEVSELVLRYLGAPRKKR